MKILLIQFKRIGDLILTSPVLAVLQRYFPDVEMDLAVEHSSAGILPAFPSHNARIFTRGTMNFSEMTAIACGNYDICLDFNGSDRSLVVSALSRANRKITYKKISKKIFRSSLYTDWVDSPLQRRHTVDHFLDILRPLGIFVENERPVLQVPQEIQTNARKILESAGVTGPYAVIHPGAAKKEKFWMPERWAQVAAWLKKNHSLSIIVTGVEKDRESARLDQLFKSAGKDCVDMVGKLNLMEMTAVIKDARLVCSVDSAPIHIAEALNVPVVALFGPMNPYVWMPRHTVCRVAHPSGESRVFSPRTPSGKMEDISVENVIGNITEIL